MAQRWHEQHSEIFTLARQASERPGHIQADLDQPSSLFELPSKQAIVYYFAPPPAQGETDSRLENFLAAITTDTLPERIIYISTSGVYGDCQGEWVTETSPLKPSTDRSTRRLAAEQTLGQWAKQHNVTCVILRVGGIYGPGKLPLQRLKQGMTILRRDEAPFSNRIHADDLAMVCQAAAQAPGQHSIYNVCDNQASSMSDYFIRVAKHAGLPAPTEIDWQQAETELSPVMLSYLHESRRMDNSKMLNELNIELTYPDLESGLSACFK